MFLLDLKSSLIRRRPDYLRVRCAAQMIRRGPRLVNRRLAPAEGILIRSGPTVFRPVRCVVMSALKTPREPLRVLSRHKRRLRTKEPRQNLLWVCCPSTPNPRLCSSRS